MNSNEGHNNLIVIYEWIKKICLLSEVREQMNTIKEGQQIIIRE